MEKILSLIITTAIVAGFYIYFGFEYTVIIVLAIIWSKLSNNK